MNIVYLAWETSVSLRLVQELEDAAFGPHTVRLFDRAEDAFSVLDEAGIDVLILEIEPDSPAPLRVLCRIRDLYPELPILALADRCQDALALEALRQGAQDVLSRSRLTGESLSRAARYALERTLLSTELRERQKQYRQIVETAQEGIWTIDAQDRTVFVNPKMTRLLGYSAQEMNGRSPLEFIDEAARPLAMQKLAAKRQGEVCRIEMPYRRKDGTLLWTTLMTNPSFDENGRYQGAMALVTDIDEQRKKEEALHRQAALVESSADAIISVDLEGTILTWNRAAERVYGFPAAEAIGRSIRFTVPPDKQIEADGILSRIRRGEPVTVHETSRLRKDGTRVPVSVTVSPFLDREGRLAGASAIIRDISEQQKLQEQFRQAQKMEAVGRLAGGVAHDFNNLLTVICGYTSLLLSNEKSSSMKEELTEIHQAGERAAGLTRQLLAFSRKQVLEPQILCLNPMIRDLEKMLRRLLGEDVQLFTDLQADLGNTRADLGQMEQVLMNLAINARDAMPEGGRLRIETRNLLLESGTAGAASDIPAGSWITLSVSDTGTGMTKEVLSHLFEPFFTTKGLGKGTGLGLSTIYGIVRQSGGHIRVSSEPGKGSCFKVYLPATTADAPALPARRAAGVVGGTEKIAVVEDNDMVRRLATEVLRTVGYRVQAFDKAEDALKAFARDGYPDLLMTDMVLPGLNGLELCRAAGRQKCGIRRLLMTGYTEEAMLHQGVSECGIPLLNKPFTPSSLLAAVRSALDPSSPRPTARPATSPGKAASAAV